MLCDSRKLSQGLISSVAMHLHAFERLRNCSQVQISGYNIRDDSRMKDKEVASLQWDFFRESRPADRVWAPISKSGTIRLGLEAGIEEQMNGRLLKSRNCSDGVPYHH